LGKKLESSNSRRLGYQNERQTFGKGAFSGQNFGKTRKGEQADCGSTDHTPFAGGASSKKLMLMRGKTFLAGHNGRGKKKKKSARGSF